MLPDLNKAILNEFEKAEQELPGEKFISVTVDKLPGDGFRLALLFRGLAIVGLGYIAFLFVGQLSVYIKSKFSGLINPVVQLMESQSSDIILSGIAIVSALFYLAWLKFKPS